MNIDEINISYLIGISSQSTGAPAALNRKKKEILT